MISKSANLWSDNCNVCVCVCAHGSCIYWRVRWALRKNFHTHPIFLCRGASFCAGVREHTTTPDATPTTVSSSNAFFWHFHLLTTEIRTLFLWLFSLRRFLSYYYTKIIPASLYICSDGKLNFFIQHTRICMNAAARIYNWTFFFYDSILSFPVLC